MSECRRLFQKKLPASARPSDLALKDLRSGLSAKMRALLEENDQAYLSRFPPRPAK